MDLFIIIFTLTIVSLVAYGLSYYLNYREERHASIVSDYVDILLKQGIGSAEFRMRVEYKENKPLMESFLSARQLYQSLSAPQKTSQAQGM